MWDLSDGATGAALVAALVSLLGLVISKEQKVSEFRQAWINDLRTCLVSYIAELNSVLDNVRLIQAGKLSDVSQLAAIYKSLNAANHGIKLRINYNEETSTELLEIMDEIERLAQSYANLSQDKLEVLEKKFLEAAKDLLKNEWARVKRGEPAFRCMKWALLCALIVVSAGQLWDMFSPLSSSNVEPIAPPICQISA